MSFDKRCPRSLKRGPKSYCELAVLRLKNIRNTGKSMTEEEENKLSGCPWAIQHQQSHYCSFVYNEKYLDKSVSDQEIAYMLNIPQEEVDKIAKAALVKVRQSQMVNEIKDTYGTDAKVESSTVENIYE